MIYFKSLPTTDRKNLILALVSAVCFGLLAHGFAFSNILFSHDSLFEMGADTQFSDGYQRKISTGRYLQCLLYWLRGELTIPWLLGIVSLIFLGVSSFLIWKIFQFPSPILVAGLLTTSLGITLTNATYSHEIDMFGLGFLCAVASVAVFDLQPKGWRIAPLLVVGACGFYQSFLSVAVVLMEMVILRDIFRGATLKNVLKKAFSGVAVLLSGVILYYFMFQVLLLLTQVENTQFYNAVPSFSELFQSLFSLGEVGLLESIYENYYQFWRHPASQNPDLLRVIHLFLLLLVFLSLVFLLRGLSLGNKLVVAVIFFLLPLTMNLSHLLSGFTHHLMESPFVLSYLLCYLVVFSLPSTFPWQKKAMSLVSFLLAMVIWMCVVYANQFYLKKQVAYDNTISTLNRIIVEMEQVEGYVVGETPVVFAGTLSLNQGSVAPDIFSRIWGLGSYPHQYATTYVETYPVFMKYIMAYPNEIIVDASFAETLLTPEIPFFPYKGYCQMVDGYLLVRLSEKLYWTPN